MTNKSWLITGTDTDVGKTRVALALLRAVAATGKSVVGMKPVASGCHVTPAGPRSEDAELLLRASNVQAAYRDVNPYAFVPAIAPHLAAAEAGVTIQADVIRESFATLAGLADCVIVEGAGGWLTPIDERQTMADVASVFGLPVVLVVGLRLGCLNHALLTRAAIAQCGLAFAGWVGNVIEATMERVPENLNALEKLLHAPPLAVFAWNSNEPSSVEIEMLTRALSISD
jgi:dethiobiotin synthetase